MENYIECADGTKTPRRSRRQSVTASNPPSHVKRSTRKTILPDIPEPENSPDNIDPITPSRPSKMLDFTSPSRSDALSTAQTPRRSVRKSIKPVQEYENIVAQKGLALGADRAISSSLEEGEETERKWMPAVIGRVSHKRGKKSRHNKKKQLKHQEKDELDQNTDVIEVSGQIHLNHGNEKENSEEKNEESEKVNPSEVFEEENTSMEGGDIIMSSMPITADDCMESPDEFVPLPKNKSPNENSTLLEINDDSDCVMLSFNESSHTEKLDNSPQNLIGTDAKSKFDDCGSAETIMPPLMVCSDDEEEENQEVIASPTDEKTEGKPIPLETDHDKPLDGTFDADDSSTENIQSNDQSATIFRPSITRIPTPYKSKKPIVPDIIIEPEEEIDSSETTNILVEPEPVVKFKSSRKRSFSICTDRPKKIVTFHSPSNTTVSIYEGDLMKNNKEDPNNVTNGRKRSASLTESDRNVLAYFKYLRDKETTQKQTKLPQLTSRAKMPNFAAIHQNQFQKMESISDLVARKAERAKILSNSAVKVKPASLQKGLPVKNSILREFNKDNAGNKVIPKARQLFGIEPKSKIEHVNSLHGGLKIRSKSKQDLTKLDDFASFGQMSTKMSASSIVFTGNTKAKQLPKPKFNLSTNILQKPLNSMGSRKVAFTASKATTAAANTTIASVSQPQTNPRLFNFTTIDTQAPKTENKLDDRRKRIMDMYKSRKCPRTGEKSKEILKGVRTNRRFELQMQCRNRPN